MLNSRKIRELEMMNTLENGKDKYSQVDIDKSAPKLAPNSKIAETLHTGFFSI